MEPHGLIETIEKLIEAEDTTGVVEAVEISQAHKALQLLSTDFHTALQRTDTLECERVDQDWDNEQTILYFEDSSRIVIDGLAQSVTAFLR